jgi:hypothetical protein
MTEGLNLRVYLQNVGKAFAKKEAVLWRRPLFEVLVADFHAVLFIIGATDLSFLWQIFDWLTETISE